MTLAEGYTIEEKVPTPDEHFDLRSQSGLTPPPRPDNEIALRNTLYGLTVRDSNGKAVGMGRLVGDGAIMIHVCDMCILPQHQRKGLGAEVLKMLLRYVDQRAPNAYLSLLADPPGVALYKKHGFVEDTYETPMLRSTFFGKIYRQKAANDASN